MTPWHCSECSCTDESLRYSSGKIPKCKDCQRYYNVTVNAKRERSGGVTFAVAFSREEFLAWIATQSRKCRYCGVTDAELGTLGIKSQIKLKVEALGIDRLDPGAHYTLSNIALCCFACNKAKGNVFTEAEMTTIGRAIAEVWQGRRGGGAA